MSNFVNADMESLHPIQGILILDSEGKRLCCKYYSDEFSQLNTQKQFETNIFGKIQKLDAEILVWEGKVVAHRSWQDVLFFVFGSLEENELILVSVLDALYETLYRLIGNEMDKKGLIDNLDYVLLAIDEIVDHGIILESDPEVLSEHVAMKSAQKGDTPIAEQTFSQAFSTATERFAAYLRS